MKTAFVCSGGGAKGSFEVGVLKQLTDKGIVPDVLYGTSTGALNAAGYAFVGIDELLKVWRAIKGTKDIMVRRFLLFIPIYLLFGKGKGVFSMKPLEKLINKLLNIKQRPENAVVCRVSLKTSAKNYVDTFDMSTVDTRNNFRRAVLASASTPMMNDVVDGEWVDGGVRQIVPLSKAIKDGATDIYIILGEPYSELVPLPGEIGNVVDVFNRTIASMVQEMFWQDIRRCATYNKNGIGRRINLTVFAPDVSLIDADDFNPAKIEASIQQGLKATPVFQG